MRHGTTHTYQYYSCRCDLCCEASRTYNRSWRQRNKELAKQIDRNHFLRRSYGVTQDDLDTILSTQDNKCAICQIDIAFSTGVTGAHIDHDHETNKIRGILCSSCNKGLGLFKDSVFSLSKAIDYLNRS